MEARQIISTLKLSRLLAIPTNNPQVIRCPQDVWGIVSPELSYLHKEHFVCLFLNTKNHIIAKETISIGSLSAAIVHPREVFRSAIKPCSSIDYLRS
ncbi:JAB domain-containing protein [Neobacillus drentensis]